MKLSSVIDKMSDLPLLPIVLTKRSEHKAVRVIGVLIYVFWVVPAVLAWFLVAALLAIPAMIQDA